MVFSLLYITSSSADFGMSVGVSGSAGIFAASGEERNPTSSTTTGTGSEHGSAGWGSIFVEGQFGDKLLVGIDYVPAALETDTTETAKTSDPAVQQFTGTKVNKIQVDFEHLTTLYVGAMLGDNMYVKAGLSTVDVITNENLGTGGSYGDTELDGSMFGIGYHNTFDNGAFFRFEGNYMSFDGASQTNSADSEKKITLKNLDGVSGKISIGKSF